MALTAKLEEAMNKAVASFVDNEKLKTKRVRFTFATPVLGGASANKEIHSEYIASKAPDALSREEEVELLGADVVEEKAMTVFHRCKGVEGFEDGTPCVLDYQIKGMFKDFLGGLNRMATAKEDKVASFKKIVDKNIFIKERQIPFQNVDGIDSLQRPLRGNAGKQEIIALANSEMLEPGCSIEFTIMYDKKLEKEIVRCLDYGACAGFLQWRNGGYGRFVWEELSEAGEVIGGNARL